MHVIVGNVDWCIRRKHRAHAFQAPMLLGSNNALSMQDCVSQYSKIAHGVGLNFIDWRALRRRKTRPNFIFPVSKLRKPQLLEHDVAHWNHPESWPRYKYLRGRCGYE